MRLLLLLIMISGPLLAAAQGDYAVSLRGDTLKGEIRIMTYDLIDRVQIKTSNKKESFTAVQIRSVLLGGKKYVPVKIDKHIRMMEVLISGYLSLYGFRLTNQMAYDGRFLAKRGGSSIEVPNLSFRKVMSSFLEDCEEVVDKISSSQWGKRDMDSIIFQYNACIDRKSLKQPTNPTVTVVTPVEENETIQKIAQLKQKVEMSDLESKKDVLDLLSDFSDKVSRKETIPNYLTEGLKSYLSNKSEFSSDLAELIELVKN